ncbi:hypothetical protein FA15DRAFT_658408 [Coprinopsis marcescibilis]|uniref:Uncharacterized protein n=1 Tax=Coprinopsis marcescibilis TaxID=230819 RepID=A0A5C3KM00_COPMA|nr:hypothetical protein FA15DRAFT_658408 [Coprinopsis marcescibilis]
MVLFGQFGVCTFGDEDVERQMRSLDRGYLHNPTDDDSGVNYNEQLADIIEDEHEEDTNSHPHRQSDNEQETDENVWIALELALDKEKKESKELQTGSKSAEDQPRSSTAKPPKSEAKKIKPTNINMEKQRPKGLRPRSLLRLTPKMRDLIETNRSNQK